MKFYSQTLITKEIVSGVRTQAPKPRTGVDTQIHDRRVWSSHLRDITRFSALFI